MKKGIITLLIIILLCGCVGCLNSKEVASVAVRVNSFKRLYEVDEKLDLFNAFLVVTYTDNNVKSIAIKEDMVEGFDTRTSGVKELVVTYNNVKAPKVSYEVVYSYEPSKEINTTARVELREDAYTTGANYTISYTKGDVEEINAFKCTLRCEEGFDLNEGNGNLHIESMLTNWQIQYNVISSNKINIILYNKSSYCLSKSSDLIKIIITNASYNKEVVVDSIEIANMQSQFNLPYYKKVKTV